MLAGGRTPERDVSLRSGHRVNAALGELGHEAVLVDPAERPLVETLLELQPTICWLALHGKEGEDGTVQRLLHVIDVAYVGSAAFDCEVAFDKMLAKDALRRAGVPTPAWVTVEAAALRDLGAGAALGTAVERVGLPCVVKPSRSGSALGVTFVERDADLPAAVMAALSFSGAAIIEEQIVGSELALAAIGSPVESLPLVEIVPKSGVYDYASRYTAGATDYFSPARISAEDAEDATAAALSAVHALGLRDIARVDLMLDAQSRPWVLEVNVSPGMTETSLVPMAARAAGMTLADVCDRVLRSALQRGGSR